MPRAEYVWFCECCGAEHREEMPEDAGGELYYEPSSASSAGWREVGNGERLVECCPDCMRAEYWKIAAGQHQRDKLSA